MDKGPSYFLRGEIDLENAADVLSALRARSSANPQCDFVVDCMDLEFIGAAGIGAFATIERELRGDGRHLRLVHPSAMLARLLEIVDLQDLIETTPRNRTGRDNHGSDTAPCGSRAGADPFKTRLEREPVQGRETMSEIRALLNERNHRPTFPRA